MAKSHLVQYFLEVEHQYLEMLDNLKEMQELLNSNSISISSDAYEQVAREAELIKSNYERLAYVMFLLNKPNRKGKKLDSTTLSWYKSFTTASKEAIIDENRDALCTFKKLIAEGKVNNEK